MSELITIVSDFYELIGIERQATSGDVYGLISILALLLVTALFFIFAFRPSKEKQEDEKEILPQGEKVSEVAKKAPPELTWRERLTRGLSRSRQEIWGKIGDVLSSRKLDENALEDIEEILYSADIGPRAVAEIIEGLEEGAENKDWTPAQLKDYLREFISKKMAPFQAQAPQSLYEFDPNTHKGTEVIMVVGVNGAGKTTTIGKLATKLTRQGAQVVVGACDTFRAAAVDQLQVWCERANAEMIRAKEGSNPSGVGYEALETARNKKADYCILDTAGRLHTKGNLMDELAKSRDVLKKLDPSAPHHILLVIDAITGQNALRQAEEFHKSLNLSGLILTKCDGSSKAGSAVAIVQDLKVPIVYIGVGESVEDLDRFELESYLDALLGERSKTPPGPKDVTSSIDVSP